MVSHLPHFLTRVEYVSGRGITVMINKLVAQREAGHCESVVPAASASARSVREVASEVNDLTARVDDLEQRIALASRVPNHPTSPDQAQPAPGPTSPREVLPQIKD